ncbi:MAG: hypothetical protein IKY91_01995 [Akkermansia sp.]|nr:hypothetical protein [Akkermansia sp.]
MKIEKVYPGQVIQLGRRGENLARQIEFDLTDWKKQYGEGIPELLFQRFGDKRPFIRDLEVVGNKAIWTLTSWDTDIAKPGKVELRWYCDELLAKSQSWSTAVENALDTPGVEPAVNPEKSWFDEVLIAATGVGAHAEAAKASADDAAASAQEAAEQLANIGDSAQRAEEARAKSEEISKKVTGEVSVAGVYADNAKVYAEGGSLQELIEQPNGDIWIGMTTKYTRGSKQYSEAAEAAANGGTYANGSFTISETGATRYADKAKAYAEGGTYQEYAERQTFGPSTLNTFTVSKGAKQYAEEARTAANEASASVASAQTAATEAYDNRVATNTYKEQARSAAQSASTSASNASKAETAARSYANAAQTSMQTIEISLTEARRFADRATSEADRAGGARDEAVTAKTAAEAAQVAAEKARDEAQAAAGGGGESGGTTAVKEIEVVESWVSTSAEVEAAYQSGKMVMLVEAGMPFHLVFRRSATEHWFANVDSEYYCTYSVINNEWEFHESMYAPRNHADIHKATGRDPITPEMIGAVTKEYVDNAVANAGGTVSGLANIVDGEGEGAVRFASATEASGANSFAIGRQTKALGDESYAEGYLTVAYNYQHVEGTRNVADPDEVYLHIVGNGTRNVASNAHTLDWDGNAWFSGDVYTGSTSGKNRDDGSKKLATEEYVDNAVANAGGGSGLPAHSSADNGKFLRIVNGAPAWATVQNAEEVSF